MGQAVHGHTTSLPSPWRALLAAVAVALAASSDATPSQSALPPMAALGEQMRVPYDRKLGDEPALSDAEILDVVAFLKTLDDGLAP
jgi:hypothetical protein